MFDSTSDLWHQANAYYTPQQNGLAERKNRILVDIVNAMLMYAKLLINLPGKVLLTTCHVHNRIEYLQRNLKFLHTNNGNGGSLT